MATEQQFCLKWNNHRSTLFSVFDTLLEEESLVDVTLSAEGQFLRAHRVILSACSPYFRVRIRLNFFRRKFFLRLTGEEKGFSPEKWRKSEKNGESFNEF